MTVWCYSSK